MLFHKEADSINAQVVIDRRLADPFGEFFEVISGGADRHLRNHQEREKKFGQGNDQRDNPDEFVIVAAQQQERQRSHGREEDQHGKQMFAGQHQGNIPRTGFPPLGQKKMTAMTTIAPITTHTA